MAKTMHQRNIVIKLPIINVDQPLVLNKPAVIISEEEYKGLLEDIQDLREALRAEEEYLAEGGKSFKEYDTKRRTKKA